MVKSISDNNGTFFAQRNEQIRKRATESDPKAQAIVEVADKLEETNLAALDRLAQLFGLATVQHLAEKSLARYEEARQQGASAYAVPAPNPTHTLDSAPSTTSSSNSSTTSDQGGTDVATKQGKPRTKGGVFFYLMKEHVTGLGINYEALHLPHVWSQRANNQGQGKQSTAPATAPATNQTGSQTAQTQSHHANEQGQKQVQGQPKAPATSPSTTSPRPPAAVTTNQLPQSQGKGGQPSQQPQPGQSGQPSRQNQEPGQKSQPSTTPPATAASAAPSATAPAPVPAAGPGQSQPPAPVTTQAAANKPGRAKLTVIGPLFGTPRFKPEGQEGLLELLIKTEMSQSLPKGLPNLGEATISVWCTVKQFNKVKDTLTPASRLIIEGEPVPALDRNNRPVIRLVALRVTTVDQEQAGRQGQQEQTKPVSTAG